MDPTAARRATFRGPLRTYAMVGYLVLYIPRHTSRPAFENLNFHNLSGASNIIECNTTDDDGK